MTGRRTAVVLLALAACLPALPAGAAQREAQGWWWRAQTGVLVDVPRPDVPEGGLYVEGAPDGPSAVSALRFRLEPGEEAVALSLKVAEERGGDQGILLACPSKARWIAAQGGRWDGRPQADCEGKGVLGERAADGSAWTFNLSLLSFDGAADLVLVPGADDARPDGLDGSVFSVAFAPPGPGALVARRAVADQDEPPRPDQDAPVFDSPPPFGPPAADPAPPDAAVGEPAPAVQDPSVLTPKITPRRDTAVRPAAGGGTGKDARALATLIALLSVGTAGVLSRDRLVTAPQGLRPRRTSAGDDQERLGGIGRFRRPRSQEPPPL